MKFVILITCLFIGISQVLAVTNCTCSGVPTRLYGDMCICGCPTIKTAYKTYTKECPIKRLAQLDATFAVKCKGVENTEDCEYFKKLPGKTTDLYKSCADKLDSVKDDCEECNKGRDSCKF